MTDAYAAAAGQATVTGAGGWTVVDPSGKSVAEAATSQSALADALKAGLSVVSQNQQITFVPYYRLVLPADGYVFWVKVQIIKPSALFGSSSLNSFLFNQIPDAEAGPLVPFQAPGSLHITTTNQQDESESFSVNRVIFTSKVPIQDLNEIAPGVMWLATIGDFRFAFSQRTGFYRQADLFHYKGDAVYPVMEQQIIDAPFELDSLNPIVSNSLPVWLTMNKVLPIYPSFLVPDNIRPPYAAVHVDPNGTVGWQQAPYFDESGSRWSLASDRVRVTLYGTRNFNALDYLDDVFYNIATYDYIGLMGSMPVVQDDKRGQTELSIIAQKKTIEFQVSYTQQTIRNLTRQLIKEAFIEFISAN